MNLPQFLLVAKEQQEGSIKSPLKGEIFVI
jgi:hypothetical protein